MAGFTVCTSGGGSHVPITCYFTPQRLRGFIAKAISAPNPWTGIDAAAQKTNMGDQAKWTTALALSAPDNLYISPRSQEFEFPKVVDDTTEVGYSKTKFVTGKSKVDVTVTFHGITPDEAAELEKWNGLPMDVQFITDTGVLGHKVVTDGTESPFFRASLAIISSNEWGTATTPNSMDCVFTIERDWFTQYDKDGVDVTAIAEVIALLTEG